MRVEALALPEVLLITPRIVEDDRGRFFELWQRIRYGGAGLPEEWVQDNVSVSRHRVLRGLHCQHPGGQGKLVTVLRGRVFDVAVDIRIGSPRFGKWVGVELDEVAHRQVYVPPGFAHGFVALSDDVIFSYKCTSPYDLATEFTIRWDDSSLAIDWPVRAPVLSPRDAAAPLLCELPPERLPALPVAPIS